MKMYIGDLETNYYNNEASVWLSGLLPLDVDDDNYIYFRNLNDTLRYLISMDDDARIYYHNLKFDASFWVLYLYESDYRDVTITNHSFLKNGEFSYVVDNLGKWYQVKFKTHNHTFTFVDSFKLLPLSVANIGKTFGGEQKGEIDYSIYRSQTWVLTDNEVDYLYNDLKIVKNGLNTFKDSSKLTIGSLCFSEYKSIIGKQTYTDLFPKLTDFKLNAEYGALNADAYIRNAYYGGWCYLNPKYEKQLLTNGYVLDVNSLYPYVMSSKSGFAYPVGNPVFKRIDSVKFNIGSDLYYFVRFRSIFTIKENGVPTLSSKRNLRMSKGSWLLNSHNEFGTDAVSIGDTLEWGMEFTLTKTDYEMFLANYDIKFIYYYDCVIFEQRIGLFDDYINKYKHIKETTTGGQRQIAKLFLNNLYGKFGTNPTKLRSILKFDDNKISTDKVVKTTDDAGFVPIAAAVTAYGRYTTINMAKLNYSNFVYADTDSVHCIGEMPNAFTELVHPTELGKWKLENRWDTGYFVRQKTYLEKDGDDYTIKCAGLPHTLSNRISDEIRQGNLDVRDFDTGFEIDGKKVTKFVKGGSAVVETEFKMR